MKKRIIPGVAVLVALLLIGWRLISNKQQLDEARTPVDRTKIPVAVKVIQAEKKAFEMDTRYPAMTEPLEEAKVYSQASGIIDYLNIDLGTKVRKGQVVGKLDTRILEINLKDARVTYEKALDDYQRAKDLYENQAGLKVDMLATKTNYEKALNQIEQIEQQIQNAQIVAPISGMVYKNAVKAGEFINPGTPIASVSNIFSLKVTVYVSQQTAYRLQLDQVGVITIPVLPMESFTGELIYISPVADDNHNYQVDLLVHPKEAIALKGGTDVQVSFGTLEKMDVLQIPKSALMTDGPTPYVFVVHEETAVVRTVKTGRMKRDQVEVLSGLDEGETVVITGQINLKEGSKVRIIK